MTHYAHLTLISSNSKTGPIPVSTTSYNSCPISCPHRVQENGEYSCYAMSGNLRTHWQKVSLGERGGSWDEFCDAVRGIYKKQLWRHNQAGDLPGDGININTGALDKLVSANSGRRGFTFTHYPLNADNVRSIEDANRRGFTVNVSCDTLMEADRARKIVRAPVTVVLHSDEQRKSFRTPDGHKVLVCPAQWRDDMSCARCQICQDSSESRCIVGFKAHSTKKKVINLRLERAA
jgi:hypothetical protein